ncbi:ComEC/Rec2 family competence protein [Sediminibacillus halophilus]|uniref:Metal-dependent hydrolase, beta-lactamase superfamily II n=1 Tax=Sediminibacillus halophilus TaxID=482461 RepID=A0A1G9VET9_9BACI|nr:ComEC/Rec2 family competence protein [Sediminibacillus halophilus]SDM70758.1 Metal-dependent hydrolase, beta-lactamase superfamily II [Sediminibacillus halophilus]
MARLIAAFVMVCLITILLPIMVSAAGRHASENELQVHFIDVGQGDSILIEAPNGRKMLVDGGPPSAAEKVSEYLRKRGIKKLDLVVATHPDIDHIGGLVNVLKEFDVKHLIDSGKLYTTSTYFHYLQQIKKQKIPVTVAAGEENIVIDPQLTIRVLNTQNAFKTNNQSSIALSLRYGRIDFLLMADVETIQEQNILDVKQLQAEILKVAHHGSGTSTSFDFIREVRPETAILSYSKTNDFGHPVDRVVDYLQLVGATIYSTAKAGDIVIRTDGKTYVVDVSGTDRVLTY